MSSVSPARRFIWLLVAFGTLSLNNSLSAQTPPSPAQIAQYSLLHKSAHAGDLATLERLISEREDLEARDQGGRTALHIAAYQSNRKIISALAKAGANMNALEHSAYDVVTIAAVANDIQTLELVLKLGASAANTTSPYEGTALIAAAHLGHHQAIQRLIAANAPLDHVNNLGWTALIEAVILGDGGPDHVETVKHLVAAGADKTIADADGITPLQHAKNRGYAAMVQILQ